MTKELQDEVIANAINTLTEKISRLLLDEFLKLPDELQINLVLIKTAQLLLANILCHVATSRIELEKIVSEQGEELKDLTFSCAFSGFPGKFEGHKH